jgi:hypothetical protein
MGCGYSAAAAGVGGGGFLSPPRTWYAVVLYCAAMGALLATRPGFAFDADGRPKDFGCSPGRSVFTLGTASAAFALSSAFLVAAADLATSGPSLPPGASVACLPLRPS